MKHHLRSLLLMAGLAVGAQAQNQLVGNMTFTTSIKAGMTTPAQITFPSAGALSLTAAGTNQNILINASGTGYTRTNTPFGIGTAPAHPFHILASTTGTAAANGAYIDYTTTPSGASDFERAGLIVYNTLSSTATAQTQVSGIFSNLVWSNTSVASKGESSLAHVGVVNGNASQLAAFRTSVDLDIASNYQGDLFLFYGPQIDILGAANVTGNLYGVYLGALYDATRKAKAWAFVSAGSSDKSRIAGPMRLGTDAAASAIVSPLEVVFTNSASSGTIYGVALTPTYTQSSTAASTDLLINSTDTSLGSGAHNFVDYQVASASKYKVTHAGAVTAVSTIQGTTVTGTTGFDVGSSSAPTIRTNTGEGGNAGSFDVQSVSNSRANFYAVAGENFELDIRSTRSADTAILGSLRFNGRDSTANPQLYGEIQGAIGSNTAGAENGVMLLKTEVAGATVTALTLQNGGIVGTTTNDAATAGNVGELITAQLAVASTTALTTATAKNITSVTVTAGDWEATGTAAFAPANTTTVTNFVASISQTSATQASVDSIGGYAGNGDAYTATGVASYIAIPPTRVSLASSTTVYLVETATFAVSTATGHGSIRFRRVR